MLDNDFKCEFDELDGKEIVIKKLVMKKENMNLIKRLMKKYFGKIEEDDFNELI